MIGKQIAGKCSEIGLVGFSSSVCGIVDDRCIAVEIASTISIDAINE